MPKQAMQQADEHTAGVIDHFPTGVYTATDTRTIKTVRLVQ